MRNGCIVSWEQAQKREKQEFINYHNKIRDDNSNNKVIDIIQNTDFNSNPTQKIIEIGCSPVANIHRINAKKKIGLDPLVVDLKQFYDTDVQMICGRAEQIPIVDNYFDVILCVNALDHMEDMEKSLSEMHRILKKGGSLYLKILSYKIINSFLEFLDSNHPHHLKNGYLEKLFIRTGFKFFKKKYTKYTLTNIFSTFKYSKYSAIKQFFAGKIWGQEYNSYILNKE